MIRTLAVRIPPAWFLGVALVLTVGVAGWGSAAAKPARDSRTVDEDFQWSWRIPAGKTIEIKGVNGSIRASRSTGSQVDVVARKHARRSDPASVKVEFVEHDDGVTVCAVYPSRRGERNECAPGEKGRMNTRDNDVTVDFEVRVPRGVRLAAKTVNGSIEADDLAGPVSAHTVNGSVEVSTDDIAEAATVNGSIAATVGIASWDDALAFSTVNGGIALRFPPRLSARVEATTVNGDISTDFPLSVRGKIGHRKISGSVGDGGPGELNLTTVNGDIKIETAD